MELLLEVSSGLGNIIKLRMAKVSKNMGNC